MAHLVPLDDPTDPRLTVYNGLTDAQRRATIDADHGVFVVEGTIALERVVSSPYPVQSALCHPGKIDATLHALAALTAGSGSGDGDGNGGGNGGATAPDVPVYVADRAVLAAVAGFDVHRGVLALAERLAPWSPRDILRNARTVAVLEGLNDQENLGAIARSARALDIDGLLLDPTCGDPLYRRSVRVSMGEVLHLPFARVEPWPQSLWESLKAADWTAVALTPALDAEPIECVQRGVDEKVAIIIGAEGPGLSTSVLSGSARRVRIPMHAGVDSINVGHAAAIAFDRLRR